MGGGGGLAETKSVASNIPSIDEGDGSNGVGGNRSTALSGGNMGLRWYIIKRTNGIGWYNRVTPPFFLPCALPMIQTCSIKADNPSKGISIYINSPGGSVTAGSDDPYLP